MTEEIKRVWIPETLHQRAKALAAMEGRPLYSILVEAMTTGPVGERMAALPQPKNDSRPEN